VTACPLQQGLVTLLGTPGGQLPLKLPGSAAFSAGVVHLTYARA
jgi:hypothetical protein